MRVALVGLGSAGLTLHLPALAGIPGVEIVGACDADPKQRAAAGDRRGIALFETFDEMLAKARPDVVVVGTPPSSHAAYCLSSLRAGAHVICEKPFVESLAEADQVIAAARTAGRQVALNHEFREMPIYRALRDQLGRPGVGDLVFVQIWQKLYMPPWNETGWLGRLARRTLYEAGVHLVDLAMVV